MHRPDGSRRARRRRSRPDPPAGSRQQGPVSEHLDHSAGRTKQGCQVKFFAYFSLIALLVIGACMSRNDQSAGTTQPTTIATSKPSTTALAKKPVRPIDDSP